MYQTYARASNIRSYLQCSCVSRNIDHSDQCAATRPGRRHVESVPNIATRYSKFVLLVDCSTHFPPTSQTQSYLLRNLYKSEKVLLNFCNLEVGNKTLVFLYFQVDHRNGVETKISCEIASRFGCQNKRNSKRIWVGQGRNSGLSLGIALTRVATKQNS